MDNAALVQQVAHAGEAPPGQDTATAELRARLDSLERDIQVLRTRSDEADQRLASLQTELKTTRDALETVARTQTAATVPAGAAPTPAGAPGGAPTAGGTPAVAVPASVPGATIGADLYRMGYSDYA